jgi:hypothetical protein
VRGFLYRFLETEFVRNRLTQSEYIELRSHLSGKFLSELDDLLFASRGRAVPLPEFGGTLTILSLREPSLREFPFLQYRATVGKGPARRRRLRCFIGHRFHPNFERSLRFNLRNLLEPYNIKIVWAGVDLRAAGLFDEIIRGIKAADFCVFDNLGTLNRPNVYIEAGIAYALEKPFIFCEYAGRQNRMVDTGSMPADLTGLLRVQYRSYQDLCEQLYFGLPDFLENGGFR